MWLFPRSQKTQLNKFTMDFQIMTLRTYLLQQAGDRCVGLTTLPPASVDCLETLEPQPPGNLRSCPGLEWDCITFYSRVRADRFSERTLLTFVSDPDVPFLACGGSQMKQPTDTRK
jgi:hypothetical protein